MTRGDQRPSPRERGTRTRTGAPRRPVHISPPYLRAMTVILENMLPSLPSSPYWLDYLAINRTCSLDTIPRTFNLLPSRFSHRLDYLKGVDWRRSLFQTVFRSSKVERHTSAS